MLSLADIADERAETLDRAIEDAKKASSSGAALSLLLKALSDVREAVSEAATNDVTVNNLDEVKASLRNELNRISKPIISAIKGLALDNKRLEQITERIKVENGSSLEETHDIQIVRKPKQRLEIANLSDIAFPDGFEVRNLSDLKEYFEALSSVIRETFRVEIPAPNVSVQAPDVIVPEIKIPDIIIPDSIINVAPPDLAPLLETLKTLKDTIRRTSANQSKQLMAFSSGGLNESSARKAFKQAQQATPGGVGSLELTSAGTAVAIASSTACRYVDISTNGGLANIGVSGAVATSGSEVGITIYPGNLPYRVMTDNLNKVYAAGATGARLSWTYYV